MGEPRMTQDEHDPSTPTTLTLPLMVVSLVAPVALRWLDRAKRHLHKFEIASGTLLAAMGLLFITGNEAATMNPATASANQVAAAATETPPTGPATCSAGVSHESPAPD
ncbi:MAG TPA: hypothetical protein VF524_08535 [Polyangia bacterium]